MSQFERLFKISLTNIPLVNLRLEFRENFKLLSDRRFHEQFLGPAAPINTPYLTWYGTRADLLTLLLQRAILGLEAYIPGVVYSALGSQGRLNREIAEVIRHPFRLGGRTTAENYYDRLPRLVGESCSLRGHDERLWTFATRFYARVRNPIFHGAQMSQDDVEAVLDAYALIARIYGWIDTWYSPEDLIKGGANAFAVRDSA